MKWFKKEKKKDTSPKHETVTRGLLIFSNTSDVMRAEQVLKEDNYDIKVVSPPPQYRTGCDLCVEFPLLEELVITRLCGPCISKWNKTSEVMQDQRLWPIHHGQGSQYENYRG
jgi:hypothetical protein